MNTTAKGNKAQRIFARYLNALGYETEIVRNTRMDHSDYFGVADIIAHNGREWLLVQVKSNKSGRANADMQAKKVPPGTMKWVAVRYDGTAGKPVRWRIKNITNDYAIDRTESRMEAMYAKKTKSRK